MKQDCIDKIVKAYRDYKNNAWADGYTRIALENRFMMSISEIEDIYNKNRPKRANTKLMTLYKIKEIAEKPMGDFDYKKAIMDIRELLEDIK